MQSNAAGKVPDLIATGKTRCHDDRLAAGFTEGGKEPLFTDRLRNLVMLFFVAERPGHPAAARVEVNNFCTRDAAQKAQRGFHTCERALVAMSLDENPLCSNRGFYITV